MPSTTQASRRSNSPGNGSADYASDAGSPGRSSPRAAGTNRSRAYNGPATSPSGPARSETSPSRESAPPASEAPILFQDYFKSMGPRTYAAQVKEARNGNHFMVFTEGKRDDKTGEIRKTKLLVFSEDFETFFRMVDNVRDFVRDNPVPAEVAEKQKKFWASRRAASGNGDR